MTKERLHRVGYLGAPPGQAEERDLGGQGGPSAIAAMRSLYLQPCWRERIPRVPKTGGEGKGVGKGRAGAGRSAGRWKVQGW